MLQIIIKRIVKLNASINDFLNYPFDVINFKFKFEICTVSFDDKTYIFDFYQTTINELTFGDEAI